MHCLEVIIARNNKAQREYEREKEMNNELRPEYDLSKLKRVPPGSFTAYQKLHAAGLEKQSIMKQAYAAWSN